MIILVVVLSILFLHFGVSEFISVQFISSFIILCAALRFRFLYSRRVVLLSIYILVIYVVAILVGGHSFHEFLVSARIVLVFCVIYSFSVSNVGLIYPKLKLNVEKGLVVSAYIIFFVAFFQFLDAKTARTGILLFSEKYYALDYGTLSSVTKHWRPSAFFSEPSTLAAWGILVFNYSIFAKNIKLAVVGMFTIFLSTSLSGVLLLGVLCAIYLRRYGLMRRWSLVFVVLILVGSYIYAISFPSVFARIFEVFGGGDLSGKIRILEPLRIIKLQFADLNVFGASRDALMSIALVDVFTIFDNFLFNLFLLFGIFGFFLLLLFVSPLDLYLLVTLLPLFVVNGEPFYYDRLLLVVIYLIARPMNFQSSNGFESRLGASK